MAITSTEEEYRSIQRSYRIVAAFALIALSGGAVFYHLVEKLSWLNAFYFCTVTLTTVGYGDIVPRTNAGKIFTTFYIIIGVGILATFASLFIRHAVARREFRMVKKESQKARNK